jgi:hypothetical protein
VAVHPKAPAVEEKIRDDPASGVASLDEDRARPRADQPKGGFASVRFVANSPAGQDAGFMEVGRDQLAQGQQSAPEGRNRAGREEQPPGRGRDDRIENDMAGFPPSQSIGHRLDTGSIEESADLHCGRLEILKNRFELPFEQAP